MTNRPSQRILQAKEISRAYYTSQFGAHYSCGITVAMTFGLDPKSYRSLRKGGILGFSECGALKAGEMVLGEFLGDLDPAGPVPERFLDAVTEYRQRLTDAGYEPYGSCHKSTSRFATFDSEERRSYCANLVEFVAGTVAEILEVTNVRFEITKRP